MTITIETTLGKANEAIFAKMTDTSSLEEATIIEAEKQIHKTTQKIFRLLGCQLNIPENANVAESIIKMQDIILTTDLEDIIRQNREKLEPLLELVYKLSVLIKNTYK